jgi:hypothetical protein
MHYLQAGRRPMHVKRLWADGKQQPIWCGKGSYPHKWFVVSAANIFLGAGPAAIDSVEVLDNILERYHTAASACQAVITECAS